MAVKKFCDRCGKQIGFTPKWFVRKRVVRGVRLETYEDREEKFYDLCESCGIAFQYFMKEPEMAGRKQKEE